VHITYFVSDRLRSMHPIPGEIEDFLREYVGFQRGRMRLAVRDPIRAGMEDDARRMGIAAQQIPIAERGQTTIATVFSGILIEYLDEVSVIPMVFSLETLEYDLTSRIRSMVRGAPRVAGVLVGDPNPRRWEEGFGHLRASLVQAGFQVRALVPGEPVPAAVSVLIVLDGVETLDEDALREIDGHIRGGGRALFAVRAVGVDAMGGMAARRLDDGGLLAMLAGYGALVEPEIVMDRTALTMIYQATLPGGAVQTRMARNFQWIRVLAENANPAHPLGAHMGALDLYWANPVRLDPPEGIDAEEIFFTTEDAWTMREPFLTSPDMASMMDRDAAETSGRRALAVSLAGRFPSPFAEGAGAEPGRIVVVGEVDFVSSLMSLTGGFHNLGFVVQALDWLGHDDDIIGIRARAAGSGRLDRISDPEARAAAVAFARAINLFVVPALVVLVGVFVSFRRKARAAAGAVKEEARHDV